MTKTLFRTFVLVLLFSFILSPAVSAQESEHEVDLGLLRTMGYGGFGGEIQGTFTISASSDGDLERVVFYHNDTVLGEDSEAPFKLQFNTEVIDPGPVEFSAVGYFSDGTSAVSDTISRTVVSGDSLWGSMSGMILPIVGIFALIVIVSFVMQISRKKKGVVFTPGKYGAAGGAVCPRCTLPFNRNFLSPNLLVGKLERCPHCGKVSILPRASRSALQEAEVRYLESAGGQVEESPEKQEDKLRKMIDDSRFDQ